jgi:hypothetical protein
MLDAVANFVQVQASTGYTSSATSITLQTGQGSKLPAAPFNLIWWNSTDYPNPANDPNVEIVRVNNVTAERRHLLTKILDLNCHEPRTDKAEMQNAMAHRRRRVIPHEGMDAHTLLQSRQTDFGFIGSSGEQRVRELARNDTCIPEELRNKIEKKREGKFEYFRFRPKPSRTDYAAHAAEMCRRFDAGLPASEVFAV